MRVMKMYPYMRRFLDTVQKEDCAEAAEAVREIREKYQESLNKYIGQADFDRFVPKAKPEMVMKCVEYTLNGLAEEFSGRGGLETEALKKENRGLSADVCRSVSIKEKQWTERPF